jgi:ankyrin repeat protein
MLGSRLRTFVWLTVLLAAGRLEAAGAEPALVQAVKAGDRAAVRALVRQRVDVRQAEPDGTTALHWAVRRDDREVIDLLLAAGARVGAANRYGVTPLSLACTNGSVPTIERLLAAGADPNGALPEGETPLMTASRTGVSGAVRALVAHGADVNARERWRGQTALMWAAAEGHASTVQLLLGAGALVRERSRAGFTPLLFAARDGHLDTIRVLLDGGASVADTTADGTSALVLAIINGHFDAAGGLLDRGADPNAPDARGSALHAVAWLRRPGWPLGVAPRIPTGDLDSLDLVRKLLARGANPNARVAWKETKRGGFDLGMVVNNPPNIAVGRNYITLVGATPYYLAAKHSDVDLMRVLAAHGADPSIATAQGVTPFMAAAGIGFWQGESPGPNNGVPERDTLEAVKLAWDLGGRPDVNAVAHFNDVHVEGEGIALLHRLPLNVHEFDENAPGDMRWGGSSAVHGAAVRGINAVVQFLVDNGGDLTATNRLGWTPLMLAEGMYIGQTEKEQPATAAFIRTLLAGRRSSGGAVELDAVGGREPSRHPR